MATVATKTKNLLDTLSRRGPHGVDTGDLGFTGTPGTVFVPRSVDSPAPLVAFAHDWTKGPRHYVDTLKHLASWGFVVVAPDTCGWALRSLGRPWVAQRVWPMPVVPAKEPRPSASRAASRLASLPSFFSTRVAPAPSSTATPEESYPRYSIRRRASTTTGRAA